MNLLEAAFIAYLACMNCYQTVLLVLAMVEVLQRRSVRLPELDSSVLSSNNTPPITIIAPAYNEEANIEESVRAFLQVVYPSLSLVVVNDGSKDRTMERLHERFALVPTDLVVRGDLKTKPIKGLYRSRIDDRLVVVDKENGGKADALNVGMNVARSPLVCCVDADSVIDRRALLRMVEPYLYSDRAVVAVGGTVMPANGSLIRDGIVEKGGMPSSWLARFQLVEYVRAFVFARMGFNRLGGNLIISGAFGLFSREAVIAAGGYEPKTVGEDAELVVRIHRTMREKKRPYQVMHISDPVCFTEVPENLTILGRQRDRWQRGLVDTLWRHRRMMLNPRYGVIGLVTLPLFALFELAAPVIELGGYLLFLWSIVRGEVDGPFVALFFAFSFVWGLLLSVQGLVLETLDRPGVRPFRQHLQMALVAALESFGYRQMTLWFRVRGIFKFFNGQHAWGEMKRKGLGRPRPS